MKENSVEKVVGFKNIVITEEVQEPQQDFYKKYGFKEENLPTEIISLIVERCEVYQAIVHYQLNQFKEKLLDLRMNQEQSIQKGSPSKTDLTANQ